jgi:hypothetical protein
MNHVVLEFEKLEILKPRERWKLYFVIVSDHPGEQDKLLVGNIPAEFIRLKPQEQNTISFKPAGDKGADGLFVLESPLPASKRIKARTYLLHSRQGTRSIGKFMKEMKGGLGADAFDVVTDMLGTSSPWLVIAKKALPLIGDVLRKIKDRDFGFISLDEKFGPEFKKNKKLKRVNTFSSGQAKLTWRWSIQD